MPISKIPVVHKFGIISHNQRLELQQRLIRKTYDDTHRTSNSHFDNKRNPLEINESFTKAVNEAKTFAEWQKLEATAEVMLERLKRKSGIRNGCIGPHTDLDSAWTDLGALVQCRGRIQDEALDVLITSLDQAPLDPLLIPGVFFLAETALYWLRTDAMQSPYLRTSEIKLLKMGHMVFQRLYFYHMVGYLQTCRGFKNRLYTYLQGLADYQNIYLSYPNVHLFLRYIIEVGNIILSDDDLDPGEMKEGDTPSPLSPVDKTSKHHTHIKMAAGVAATPQGARSASGTDDDPTAQMTLSHSVHDLTPTLWHSLDVWRCCCLHKDDLALSLNAIVKCGAGLSLESWVDASCAIVVLGEAAKLQVDALVALQRLAQGGGHSHDGVHSSGHSLHRHALTSGNRLTPKLEKLRHAPSEEVVADMVNGSEHPESSKSPWNDTAVRPSVGTSTDNAGRNRAALTPLTYTNSPVPADGLGGLYSWRWEVSCMYADILSAIVLHGTTSAIQKKALMGNHTSLDTVTGQPATPIHESAGLVDLLTFNPRSHATATWTTDSTSEQTSAVHTVTMGTASCVSVPCNEAPVSEQAVPSEHQEARTEQRPPGGAVETNGDGNKARLLPAQPPVPDEEWAWRLRYSTVQSLVHICRCLRNDDQRSGLRQTAATALLRAQNGGERDSRVLEALKVGQASAQIEDLLQGKLLTSTSHSPTTQSNHVSGSETERKAMATSAGSSTTIGTKIAKALSERYLPPVHRGPVRSLVPPPPASKRHVHKLEMQHESKLNSHDKLSVPLRTTLRGELNLAGLAQQVIPDFNTRTSVDLMRIVEDQWRKDLHQQLEDEESERLQQLETAHQMAKSGTTEERKLVRAAVARERTTTAN